MFYDFKINENVLFKDREIIYKWLLWGGNLVLLILSLVKILYLFV